MEFKERLKQLRKGEKLTQEELGLRLDVTKRTIINWEQGDRQPNHLEDLIRIAEYFGVTTDYLLGITDNPRAEIIQTTFLDDNGKEHTLEIQNEVNTKEDKISLKELGVLIQLLKKLGLDPNKINLSTF